MAIVVGYVPPESWHSEVPRRTRSVCEPHQAKGVSASEP